MSGMTGFLVGNLPRMLQSKVRTVLPCRLSKVDVNRRPEPRPDGGLHAVQEVERPSLVRWMVIQPVPELSTMAPQLYSPFVV